MESEILQVRSLGCSYPREIDFAPVKEGMSKFGVREMVYGALDESHVSPIRFYIHDQTTTVYPKKI